MSDKPSRLKIADREFTSRLLVGTGKFGSNELMRDALVASGTETDSFRGMTETFTITDEDTGIPSTPGHYTAADILGFSAPGVAIQIQVAFRPAK